MQLKAIFLIFALTFVFAHSSPVNKAEEEGKGVLAVYEEGFDTENFGGSALTVPLEGRAACELYSCAAACDRLIGPPFRAWCSGDTCYCQRI